MQFKEATDILFDTPDVSDLASRIGATVLSADDKTVETINRARNNPAEELPNGWDKAVAHVAQDRC